MKTTITTIATALLVSGGALFAGETCCGSKDATATGCPATGACTASVSAPVAPKATYGEIDTAGLQALLNAGTPVTLLDARTGQWDDGRRIVGAKALAPDATAEQAAALIPAKNSLVVAYCSGLKCPASKKLAENLIKLGYTNLVKYPDGIDGWTAAGNKIVASK